MKTARIAAIVIFVGITVQSICYGQIKGNSIQYTYGVPGVCGGTSFTAGDVIHGSIPPALSGGNGSFTYQWVSSINTGYSYTAIPGATKADYFPGTITQTTVYERIVRSGSLVDSGQSLPLQVDLRQITGNIIFIKADHTTEHDIPCGTPSYNPGPISFNASEGNFGNGGTGNNFHFQWFSTTDNGATYVLAKDAGGIPVVSEGYTPGPISNTVWYVRVVASAGNVCSSQSAPVKFIFGATASNFITKPAVTSSCGGGTYTPQTIVGSTLPAGYTFTWQSGPDSLTFTNIAGQTSQNLSPAPITSTTAYRRVTTSSGGCVSYTNSVVISVAPPFSSNVIGSYQKVDSAATPAQLFGAAVTGGANIISYDWQTSKDSLGTYTDVAGLNGTPDYQPGPAVAVAFYRRVAFVGACQSISNIVQIYVNGVHHIIQATCPGGVPSVNMGIHLIHKPGTKTTGASYDYTLSVTNYGPDDATNIVVRDTLPSNIKWDHSVLDIGHGSYDYNTHVATWYVGSLRKLVTVNAIFVVIPLTNDQIISKIGITADQCDPDLSNNNKRDTINDPLPVFSAKYIPDIITPNGDGKNDKWVIQLITNKTFIDNSVVIFDRWGNTVFSAKGYQNNWDGTGLNAGTYFYVLTINNSATILKYQGYITLMR